MRKALDRMGWKPADLRRALQARGLTFSRETVSRWAQGKTIGPAHLGAVSEALGLSATEAADFYAAAGVPLPSCILALIEAAPPSSEGPSQKHGAGGSGVLKNSEGA